jgi:hypothetical protein
MMLVILCFGVRICYLLRTHEKWGIFFTALYNSEKSPLKCTFQLSCKYHLFRTVQATDIDILGGSHGITTAGADILPGGISFADSRRRGRGVRAGSCDSVAAVFVAVDQDVTQVIVQAELQETVTGTCDCPSVLVVMIHDQTMSFCAVPEFAVVVSASTGTILDSQNVIVVMNHFVKQGGTDFFDGTGKGTGSNIYFVGSALLADPGVIPQGEVAVGLRCRLDSYSWP